MKKQINKLKKINGQISGLIKMLEFEESNCEEIIIQFQAVKGALNSTFLDILENNLNSCLKKDLNKRAKIVLKQLLKNQ
jgi:DNA-binding FrmR family transcriptional regulator